MNIKFLGNFYSNQQIETEMQMQVHLQQRQKLQH